VCVSGRDKMKSTDYREFARSCLAMVESVSSEEARASLISMAQCWHRLAQEAEEATLASGEKAADPDASGPDVGTSDCIASRETGCGCREKTPATRPERASASRLALPS
jgi:hypothetical protein